MTKISIARNEVQLDKYITLNHEIHTLGDTGLFKLGELSK